MRKLIEQLSIMKNSVVALRIMSQISLCYVILVFFSSLISSIYNIFSVLIVKIVIDLIGAGNDVKFAITVFWVFSIGSAIHLGNAFLKYTLMPRISNKISTSLNKAIYKKYLSFTYDEISKDDFYNQYFFLLEESEKAFTETVKLVSSLLTSLITIIGLSYIIINYELYILATILVSVTVFLLLSMFTEKQQYNLVVESTPNRRRLDYLRKLFYMQEYAKELRLNNSDLFFSSMEASYSALLKQIEKWGVKLLCSDFLSKLSITLADVIILLVFGYKTIRGHLDIGAFSMLYMGSQKLSRNLIQFFSLFPRLYFYALNIDKHQKFMSTPTDTLAKREMGRIKKIEIENLDYDYNGHLVFRDVNLTLSPGNIYFVVGKNGTGKSTLLHLIAGILRPAKGQILINGIDLAEYTSDSYLRRMGFVSQDFKIFLYSIAQNIMMKYDLESDDYLRAIQVIEITGLREKVESFSNGINSTVSNEFDQQGVGFSIGEQQRLALARALVKDSDVVIFDEAFSFSDSRYRTNIIPLIKKSLVNKLVILVSHDLSYIGKDDQIIYVTEEGVIRMGELGELLKSEEGLSDIFEHEYCCLREPSFRSS